MPKQVQYDAAPNPSKPWVEQHQISFHVELPLEKSGKYPGYDEINPRSHKFEQALTVLKGWYSYFHGDPFPVFEVCQWEHSDRFNLTEDEPCTICLTLSRQKLIPLETGEVIDGELQLSVERLLHEVPPLIVEAFGEDVKVLKVTSHKIFKSTEEGEYRLVP